MSCVPLPLSNDKGHPSLCASLPPSLSSASPDPGLHRELLRNSKGMWDGIQPLGLAGPSSLAVSSPAHVAVLNPPALYLWVEDCLCCGGEIFSYVPPPPSYFMLVTMIAGYQSLVLQSMCLQLFLSVVQLNNFELEQFRIDSQRKNHLFLFLKVLHIFAIKTLPQGPQVIALPK